MRTLPLHQKRQDGGPLGHLETGPILWHNVSAFSSFQNNTF